MRRYSYLVQFTDGRTAQQTRIDAPDIFYAGVRARSFAREMIRRSSFGVCDWSGWRMIIDVPEEGRFDEAFPAGA